MCSRSLRDEQPGACLGEGQPEAVHGPVDGVPKVEGLAAPGGVLAQARQGAFPLVHLDAPPRVMQPQERPRSAYILGFRV